jgi:hypothetical protein
METVSRLRRVLWNIYAWPITILLVALYYDTILQLGRLGIVDVLISIPALVALHLHIWDKRVLSASFWKPYAFVLPVWDLALDLLLAPLVTEKNPGIIEQLLGLCILVPLYVAVFRYAFRDWKRRPPNQSSGTRQFWICPQCRRHVPSRLTACQCGFSRQDVSGIQFAPPIVAAQAQQGDTGNVYVKAKVWDKPCPRCEQPSSVDVYLLAPIWRVGAILTGLAAFAIVLFHLPYGRLVVMLAPLYSILMLKVSSRAECRHCGAKLHQTLLGGWA